MTISIVNLRVNGENRSGLAEPRLLLSDFLRHTLRLTGTHVGCEHGVCGACTVIFDGRAVRSCLMLAVQADGAEIVTIEGLALGGELTPLQQAFQKHHALQCGFCTSGVLTTLHAFLAEEPEPSAENIRDVLSGTICRCTGYIGMVDAALEAASVLRERSKCRD